MHFYSLIRAFSTPNPSQHMHINASEELIGICIYTSCVVHMHMHQPIARTCRAKPTFSKVAVACTCIIHIWQGHSKSLVDIWPFWPETSTCFACSPSPPADLILRGKTPLIGWSVHSFTLKKPCQFAIAAIYGYIATCFCMATPPAQRWLSAAPRTHNFSYTPYG